MSSIVVVGTVLRIFNVNSWLAKVMCASYRVIMKATYTLLQSMFPSNQGERRFGKWAKDLCTNAYAISILD